ncbi:hypothetical protein [Cohnella silvisoli]|uniref:EXPERA domain-containing protein n=1 Tax=Cohnella silvisoli TaxID=2873699 RepID=A0ABV1KXM1_9BACL|nr:hypothetical protein [Cohnella silvisoli]MCD9024110.1 hypothetical protein [Cohnella silvisoli]
MKHSGSFFDQNEWFILLSLLLLFALLFRLPRRFPFSVSILIYVFCFAISIMSDLILGTPPLDLYDINDTPKYSYADFLTWNLYPPFGYLFLYVYDRFRFREISVLFYIVFCALLAVGFEWLTVMAGIFKYKGWNLAHSFPTYLIVLASYVLFFHLVMYSFRKTRRKAVCIQ